MRRSGKQDLLLAVCSKMGEVIPFLADEDCDACIQFLKKMHDAATQSVESVAFSPAFQKLSLRELLTTAEKADVKGTAKAASEGKKIPKAPKIAVSPRASSTRVVRKRTLWSEDDDGNDERDAEFVREFQKKAFKKQKELQITKPKKNDGLKKNGVQSQLWDAAKHSVVVGVESYDKTADALVVNAKVSAHGKAKVHRVLVKPEVIDKIKEENWPQMSVYFSEHEMPASFAASRFAKSCAKKK
jgi:hypothetical protein